MLRFFKFFWVLSHIRILGNEIANVLAKATTNSEVLDVTKIPFTDLSDTLKCKAKHNPNNMVKEQGISKGNKYSLCFRNGQFTIRR